MDRPTSFTGPWQCGVCFDDFKFDKEEPIEIEDSTICRECAQSQLAERFEAALKNEFEPARWGHTILDVNDFADLLDPDFMKKWNAGKLERDVPVKNRVYCKHREAYVTANVDQVGERLAMTQLEDAPEGAV